jgi:hypothetical protein
MKIDREELAARATTYGKLGFGFAVKAVVLYIVFTILGLVGGGFGGYFGADHFGYGGWWGTLAAILGVAAGGIAGFFTAKIIVFGMVEDVLWSAGIKAGKVGYKKGMELMKEQRERATAPAAKKTDGEAGSA